MTKYAPDELRKEISTAFESFDSPDRSFCCRLCGTHFTPRKGQWIFYNLCDNCFNEFDRQKYGGIFSCDAWIEEVMG